MTTDRLDILEAELARIKGERAQEKAAAERKHEIAPRVPTGMAREALETAAARLEVRRSAHAEWARTYEQQLEANQPKITKIEAQLAEIGVRQRDLMNQHGEDLRRLAVERAPLNEKLAALQAPPPQPIELSRDLPVAA